MRTFHSSTHRVEKPHPRHGASEVALTHLDYSRPPLLRKLPWAVAGAHPDNAQSGIQSLIIIKNWATAYNVQMRINRGDPQGHD